MCLTYIALFELHISSAKQEVLEKLSNFSQITEPNGKFGKWQNYYVAKNVLTLSETYFGIVKGLLWN